MPNKLGSSLVFPVKGLVKRRTPRTSPSSSSNRSQSSHAAPRKAAQSLKRWDVSSGYLKTAVPAVRERDVRHGRRLPAVLPPDGGTPAVADRAEAEMLVAGREEAHDLAKHVRREVAPAESALFPFPAQNKNYHTRIEKSC